MSDLRIRARGVGETRYFTAGATSYDSVADQAAVQAIQPQDRFDGKIIAVTSESDLFIFLASSTAAAGVSVFVPNDITPPAAGRWHREIEKALPLGVGTLDANGYLVQPSTSIRTTGPSAVTAPVGVVPDGNVLKRSGTSIVGVDPAAGGVITPRNQSFSGNGVLTAFTLAVAVPAGLVNAAKCYRNGLRIVPVDPPTSIDEYKVSGTTLTIGAAPANGELILIDYWT